EADPNKFYGLM
nr:physalaemin [Physalaemus fuscomaculatus]